MRILKILLVILVILAVGFGEYYYLNKKANREKEQAVKQAKDELQKEISDLKKQLEEQKTASSTTQKKLGPCESATQDEYAGWKTYTNQKVGYCLRYPSTWTLKETDQVSETIGKQVTFVQIYIPSEKYFLHFGLKKPTDTFVTTDRTGVGAGDMVQKPADKFKILGVTVVPEAHIWESKIKEYFYPQPSGTSTTCTCEFNSSFGYNPDKIDYDAADLTGSGDFETSIKILNLSSGFKKLLKS